MISTLIHKQDNVEIVRDQIGLILLTELAAQQALAPGAGQDPGQWALRVFTEREMPWDEFQAGPENGSADATPIVNIAWQRDDFEKAKSNKFERQNSTALYHLDCYGYGVNEATIEGHDPADEVAAFEAQRAARLVRNILMAAHYTYLGLPRGDAQVVWGRWLRSREMFKPAIGNQAVFGVVACRLAFEVELNEFAPQVDLVTIEAIRVAVNRELNGELQLLAEIELPVSP